MEISTTLSSSQLGVMVLQALNAFSVPEGGMRCDLTISLRTDGVEAPLRTLQMDAYYHGTRIPLERAPAPTGEAEDWLGSLFLSGEIPPESHLLRIHNTQGDQDGLGTTEKTLDFTIQTLDNTPPRLLVVEPTEDRVFVVSQEPTAAAPYTITVSGTVRDRQSGLAAQALDYSFAEDVNAPLTVTAGAWSFPIEITSYGPYEFRMSARDISGNEVSLHQQFEVMPAVQPRSIDDLLSVGAYLNELLRFAAAISSRAGRSELRP